MDAVFEVVEKASNVHESDEPACMAYEHYQSIFDEIYLSVEEHYGRTPNTKLQRQAVSFTELFKRRKEKVKTLRGTTYWINEDGLSIKDLIDKCQRC